MSGPNIDGNEKQPTSVSKSRIDVFSKKIKSILETKRDQPFATWYDDNGNFSHQLTFGQVCNKAAVVSHFLRHEWNINKGERVILCYGFGLNFFVALLGCLRAGIVPVLVYPPAPPLVKSLEKLTKVKSDCNPKLILTDKQIRMAMRMDQNRPWSKSRKMWPTDVEWKVTEDLSLNPGRKRLHKTYSWMDSDYEMGCGQDVAFLQYTSGSTGEPKGVMVTFGALAANEKLLSDSCEELCRKNGGVPESNVGFSWLPQYHDMGLISGVIVPFFLGFHMHMMAPTTFIRNPLLWLELMSRHRVVWSVAPAFAFHLVARKFTEAQKTMARPIPNLDLSSIRFIMTGAEPIRPNTKDCFQVLVSEYGLHENWFVASYGLAEHVLACCWQLGSHLSSCELKHDDPKEDHPKDPSLDSRVAVGSRNSFHPSVELKVVCPDQHVEVEDGKVGELWVSGPSVTAGYYAKPELSREVFHAKLAEVDSSGGQQSKESESFLRTGDLAFFQDDYLYICGRIKDLIIVDGVNYYPQDIETVTQDSSEAIRPGCVAAFSSDETANDGKLEVVFEIRRKDVQHAQRVCELVREAILAHTGLVPVVVVAIAERTIPKTTSGKICRRETRTQLHSGKLEVVYVARAGASLPSVPHMKVNPCSTSSDETLIGGTPNSNKPTKNDTTTFDAILKDVLGLNDLDQIQDMTWDEIGLTSLASVTLADAIGNNFGVSLPPNFLDVCQTPHELRSYLKESVSRGDRINFPIELPILPHLKNSATTNIPLIITTLQAVGVLVLLLMFSANIIPPWYFGILVSRHHDFSTSLTSNIFLWMFIPLTVPVWILSSSLMVIVVKWIVIGRYTPGVMSIQSFAFVRWWFVDRLVHFWETWVGSFISGTPLLCFFYWLLGAKIHLSAKVDAFIREFDLVSIGPDSSIEHQIRCRKFTFQHRDINDAPPLVCFRTVSVGENCKVRGMICPGVSLGDNSHVNKNAVVTEGSQVPQGAIASGNPAQHHGSKVVVVAQEGERNQQTHGGVKIIWLFMEAYLFFGLLALARIVLGEDIFSKGWRYDGLLYYVLLIGFASILSVAVGIVLKWMLLGCNRDGDKSSWQGVLEWIVDYHFSLSTGMLMFFSAFSHIWNCVFMLLGMDVDAQSAVHSQSVTPSKADLITIKRSFVAFNMSFDVPSCDPASMTSSFCTAVSDDQTCTSESNHVQVIDSSVGYRAVIGPGVKLSGAVVPPFTTALESVHNNDEEDEESGRKNPPSLEARPTVFDFCATELCYIVFYVILIMSLVPSYEVWDTLMQHGDSVIAVPALSLALVIQTFTWMALLFVIQMGALGFFGFNKSAVRKMTEPWCRPMYVLYLTAAPMVQTSSMSPILWGTPFFNSLFLRPLGATVHANVRYFGRAVHDIPLVTFLDGTIVDGADAIAHYQVFGKVTLGPNTARGVLHPGTWTAANTDMSDSPKTTESGPLRWVLPPKCSQERKVMELEV